MFQNHRELLGLYVATGYNTYPNRYSYRMYLLFLPQGRVYKALPKGGQLDNFDFTTAQRTSPTHCGTYSLKGDIISFRWASGTGNSDVPMKWLQNGIDINGWEYYRITSVNHQVLNGTYESTVSSSGADASLMSIRSIKFYENGQFERIGVAHVSGRSRFLSPKTSKSEDAGRYDIRNTTITMEQKREKHVYTFYVYPGDGDITSKPRVIVIDDILMRRTGDV